MLDTPRNLTNGRKMAEDPAKPNYSRSDVRYWRAKVQKLKKVIGAPFLGQLEC